MTIIRTLEYNGKSYPTQRDINQVDKALPKFYITPVWNYDNSNTEQVKYYNLLFKCSSESEKETVEAAVLALTSDNVVTGYNKTDDLEIFLDIDSYNNDKSFEIEAGTNVLITEVNGEFAYISDTTVFKYATYLKFLLEEVNITEFTLTQARLYFYAYENVSTFTYPLAIAYTCLLNTSNIPSLSDDLDDLTKTTKNISSPYFNNSDSVTSLTANTQYYIKGSSPAGDDDLYEIINEVTNDSNWDGESIIIENLSLTNKSIKMYAKDSDDSNTGKYARLKLYLTPPSTYPFYIDIKQVPVEMDGRVVDYDPNNYYCQFQVEARWAI